jgi:hypothetical protein
MPATIEPEPTEDEREAILAALSTSPGAASDWASAALAEGVENDGLEPYLFLDRLR